MKALIAIWVVTLALGTAVASANPAHHPQPAGQAAATEPGRRPGGAGMMGMTCPMMGGHVEGSLAFIKTELKITDAQGSAWNNFADAYRAFAASKPAMMMQGGGMMSGGMTGGESGGMAQGNSAMPQGRSAMSYPDRMKAHMQMMEEHVEAGKKFAPAAEALYASLTAEQKKAADDLLPMFTMMGGMM